MASYGSLFRSKDERLQPNLLAVYNKLHSAEIKDSVRQPDPLRDRTSRNIARLYQTGADAVLVKKNIRRTSAAAAINGNIDNSLKAIANNSQGRTNSSNILGKLAPSNTMGTVSEELVPVRKAKTRSNPRKPDPMNATIALQLHDRSSSGKFFVPEIREPYEAKFEGKKAESVYSVDSPKMWPPETMYTNSSKHRNLYDSSTRSFYGGGSLSATNTSKSLKRQLFEQNSPEPMHPLIAARPCSKSVSIVATNSSSMVRANSADLGGLSALQSTLVKCGKLQIFDDLHEVKQEKEVEQCLKAQRSKMVRHSKWLQGKNSNPYECSSTLDCKSNPAPSTVVSAKSSATERRDDSSVKFLRDLGVANTMSTSNPFRQDKQPRVSIPARSKPRMGNPLDPSDYKDDMYVRRLSNYNACIVPDSTVYGVPSRAEVNATLVKLARTTVLSFTSRVVECGSVLRSLKSANHRSPGLMAIVDLHKAFVNAAALNPNGWLLHKRQLQSVIESKVPWMANASIVRFVRSFDPQNTGMIRYVKISACLLGGMPPAINELSSMLNRVKARMPKEEDSVYQAASGGGINGMLSDYLGELTLIRLIHNLYEECAGSTELSTDEQINQTKSTSAAISPKHYRVGVGMKVEDIAEALSCCCSNIEDEVIIQQLTQNLILYFFQLKGVIGSTEIDTNNKTTRTATLTEFQRHRKAKLFSNGTASTVPVQGGQSAAWGSQFEDSVSVISGDTNRYGSQTTMLNNAGAVESALIMKYESIRSMKQIPRISQDELVHCLLEVPELLDEFVRQVRNFRKIVLPYILKGTVTLDDAIAFGAKGQH